MGEHFRKAIVLAPGVRLTRPGSGMAWRLGPRGATVTIGKRCPVLASGQPVPAPKPRSEARPLAPNSAAAIAIRFTAEVNDFGEVIFTDLQGNPLPDEWVEKAALLRANEMRVLMQKKCDELNRHVEMLGELHLYCPPPDAAPTVEAVPFKAPRPKIPVLKSKGFLAWLFKSVAQRIDAENAEITARYEAAKAKWEADKSNHEARLVDLRRTIDQAGQGQVPSMERLMEIKLAEIVWPAELKVTMDIDTATKTVRMDVMLPDIEEMPAGYAMPPAKGYSLATTEMTQSQVRWLYMRLVHAVMFRLIGETFASLQLIQCVLIAGYTSKKNPDTGDRIDTTILAAAVRRIDWRKVGFSNIRGVDVVGCFNMFKLRRGMARTGLFKPVEPFTAYPEETKAPSPADEVGDDEELES